MPILAVALLMAMQGAPRDQQRPAARGAGQIVGVLLSDAQEPVPIRHAAVTCTSPEIHGGQTTATDERGRFAFTGLAAARYSISAQKAGWVAASYGAKRPGGPGTPVPVSTGQRVDITIRMTHGGVLTGSLVDQDGQPAVGSTVQLLRYSFVTGERALFPAGGFGVVRSDGTYRIYGLAPGDYVVGSRTSGVGGGPFATAELRLTTDLDVQHAMDDPPGTPPPAPKTVDISPTYFPGTTDVTQATVISLHAGEERSGVDFALQLVSTATLDGSVTMPDGTSRPGAQVTLLAAGGPGVPGMMFTGFKLARPGPDGRFSIGGVAPGQYTLMARLTVQSADRGGAPSVYWAATDVSVQGDRVSGLALVLEPAMVLSGKVQFDGATLPPNPRTIRITLRPASQGLFIASQPGTVNPDGTFSLSGVTPGQYRVQAAIPESAGPHSWQLRSAEASGHDVLDSPLIVQPNQNVADVVITFTDHPAQLTGTLETRTGAPAADYSIILFSEESTYWQPQSRHIQETRPAADGTYMFRNVAPGDYLLAAVGDVEQGQWFDPSFLQTLVPGAMKITIAEGEQKVQAVRLGGS